MWMWGRKVDNNVRYIFQAKCEYYYLWHCWWWLPCGACLARCVGPLPWLHCHYCQVVPASDRGQREPHPTGYNRPAPAPATLCILEGNGSLEIMFRCHYWWRYILNTLYLQPQYISTLWKASRTRLTLILGRFTLNDESASEVKCRNTWWVLLIVTSGWRLFWAQCTAL